MMKRRHDAKGGGRRRQQGIATILIVLLLGLAITVTVLAVAHSLRSAQQRQLSTHAATAAQGAAWRGVEIVRGYLQRLGRQALEVWGPAGAVGGAGISQDQGGVACRDHPDGLQIEGMGALGITGRLTRVCAANAQGRYRVTAEITGHASGGTAATTSTVEVVYEVAAGSSSSGPGDDGDEIVIPLPAASFVGTLNYEGSTLEIVNGEQASDIAVDGDINFIGAAAFSACSTRDIHFTSNNYCGAYYHAAGDITGAGATFGKFGSSCNGGVSDGVTLAAGGGVDLSARGSNSNGTFWAVRASAGDIRIDGTSRFLAPSQSLWGGASISLGSAGEPVGELLAAGDLRLGAGNQLARIARARVGGDIHVNSWGNRIDAGSVGGEVVVHSGSASGIDVEEGGEAPTAPGAPDCVVPPPSIDVPALRSSANLLLDLVDGRPTLLVQNMSPASLNTSYDLGSASPSTRTAVAALFGCNAHWCRDQAIPSYDAGTGTWTIRSMETSRSAPAMLPGMVWVNGSLFVNPLGAPPFYNGFLVTRDIVLSNNNFVIHAPNFAAEDADVCRAGRNPVNLCADDFSRTGGAIGNMAIVAGRDATLNSITINGNVVIGNSLSGTSGSLRINGRLSVGSSASSEINFKGQGSGFHMVVDTSDMSEEQAVIETGGEPATEPEEAGEGWSRVVWTRYL